MANARQLFPVRGVLVVGAAGGVLTGITLAVRNMLILGSMVAANFVGVTGKNVNPSVIVDTTPYVTPYGTLGTECSKTGCVIRSPYRAGADARGLPTGTGVSFLLMSDMISNTRQKTMDCTLSYGVTNTGGTLLVDNQSATGSTVVYNTPFVWGPTQNLFCKFAAGATNTGVNARVKGVMIYSNVLN